jgi:hypothetical protein
MVHKGLLEGFWEGLSPSRLPRVRGARVTEAVCRDAPPIGTRHMKGVKGNTLLSHISGSSRRMVVAVLFLKLCGRNVTVLEDVIQDYAGPFGRHPIDQLLKGWVNHRDPIRSAF